MMLAGSCRRVSISTHLIITQLPHHLPVPAQFLLSRYVHVLASVSNAASINAVYDIILSGPRVNRNNMPSLRTFRQIFSLGQRWVSERFG
jgi:hypothetical protein